MEKRYRALRIIGTVYKILGAILAVLTILGVIGICIASIAGGAAFDSILNQYGSSSGVFGTLGGVLGGFLIGFFVIIYGGGMAITMYALGEGVYLLLSLEENTRTTAALLQQQNTPHP